MSKPGPVRLLAGALFASAALYTGLQQSEGFVAKAMKPVPEDRWTVGYGSTYHADGSPVKRGETITEPEARKLLEITVRNEYEAKIKACAGDIPMRQAEYDAVIDLAYNVGAEKVCRFSIFRKFRAGDYAAGCAVIPTVDMLNGKHCRAGNNLRAVPGCRGLMTRRQRQYAICKGES